MQHHLEDRVFELQDRLSVFVSDHALALLVTIILLTAAGGPILLLYLRRCRNPARMQSPGEVTVGYGVVIGNPPTPPPVQPPPTTPEAPPWDDLRD